MELSGHQFPELFWFWSGWLFRGVRKVTSCKSINKWTNWLWFITLFIRISERGAARLAHLTGGQGVAGSNPIAPTNKNNYLKFLSGTKSSSWSQICVNLCLFYYKLKQVDFDGRFTISESIYIRLPLADKYELRQNYPNPFNPETTIGFSIPVGSNIYLDIYNIEGRLVKSLVMRHLKSGNHTVKWDGTNDKV